MLIDALLPGFLSASCFTLYLLAYRLFKPLPNGLPGLDRLNTGSLVGVWVESEADVGRAACSWPSGSWTHLDIVIVVVR